MKVVINTCFGGFSLSVAACERYAELKGLDKPPPSYGEFDRADPLLIQVVEELGRAASSGYAGLEIVDIPDDVEWHIHYYDGLEHVAENHRTWP